MGAGVESGNVSYCVRRESTTATAGRLRLQARYAAAAASGVRTARVQHYGTACNDQPPALRNSCTQLFPSALSERKVMGNLVTETLWCVAAAFAASRYAQCSRVRAQLFRGGRVSHTLLAQGHPKRQQRGQLAVAGVLGAARAADVRGGAVRRRARVVRSRSYAAAARCREKRRAERARTTRRVPLYDELKLLFLLWAVAPQFKVRCRWPASAAHLRLTT